MSDNKHRLKATFILADSCLFDVLPRPMLIGDPKQVLSQPMYVLVSDEIAERIGGNVMGKRFEIDDAPTSPHDRRRIQETTGQHRTEL